MLCTLATPTLTLARVKPFKPQRASIVTKGRYICQNPVPIGLVGKLLAWELWAFAARESHIVGGRVEELPLPGSGSEAEFGISWRRRSSRSESGGFDKSRRSHRSGTGGVRLRLEERLQRFGRRTSATAVEA